LNWTVFDHLKLVLGLESFLGFFFDLKSFYLAFKLMDLHQSDLPPLNIVILFYHYWIFVHTSKQLIQ